MLSNRARFVDESSFPLVSSKADLDSGRYRFQLNGRPAPVIARNDYLVTGDTAPIVRIVLERSVAHGVMTIETGPAYLSDVLRSGTYGVRMPLVPGEGTPTTLDGTALRVGPTARTVPNMEQDFDTTDVCALIDSLLTSVSAGLGRPLCGEALSKTFNFPDVVAVTVSGTIDSLLILGGKLAVNGGLDLAMTLDAGGLTGGRLPTFYPCNQAAYLGCLSTPTGANLIDFLRKFAPNIPEASLPPVRLCIPGTPIRVQRGYWTWSGFIPHYHEPVFTACKIADIGKLPTIVYPSITNVSAHVYPHIHGSLDFKAIASGSLGLEIAIPEMAVSASAGAGADSASGIIPLTVEVNAGVFLGLEFALKNFGTIVHAEFNDSGVVTQSWTSSDGWHAGYDRVVSDRDVQFKKVPADSAAFVLKPEVKADVNLCLLVCGDSTSADTAAADTTSYLGKKLLSLLKIEAKVDVGIEKPVTLTWSRQVVDPADTAIDNWHLALDAAYTFVRDGALTLPGEKFIWPNVPTEWGDTVTFDSVHMGDMWGHGNLWVHAHTTGTATGTDPYVVTVARADTFPQFIASGATRTGPATGDTATLTMNVGPNDSTLFASSKAPCTVFYSDAAFSEFPIAGQVVHGLRAHGVGIPNYAIPAFCKMLIARYKVTLGNVPQNCTVDSGAVRDSVWLDSKKRSIGRSDTTSLNFNVTCNGTAPTGDLQLTTSAPGALPDSTAPYALQVDSVPWGLLGPDTTVTVAGLLAGDHTLHFAGGPTNCVEIDSTVVTITANATTTSTVSPSTCAAAGAALPGEVDVHGSTTGSAGDPSGYLLKLDGVTRASMADTGIGAVKNIPPNVPSVIQVADIAANCRPTNANPFVVTLDSADDPISVSFPVTCTTAPIDSLRGVVRSLNLPGSTVALTGSKFGVLPILLSGGPTAELATLTGMQVLVWGVRQGASLQVYGYELTSTLAQPRWVGIVEARGSDLWLYGDEALQLVNPPPGLTAAVGDYVWVTGTKLDSTVTPTAYGVIREAP